MNNVQVSQTYNNLMIQYRTDGFIPSMKTIDFEMQSNILKTELLSKSDLLLMIFVGFGIVKSFQLLLESPIITNLLPLCFSLVSYSVWKLYKEICKSNIINLAAFKRSVILNEEIHSNLKNYILELNVNEYKDKPKDEADIIKNNFYGLYNSLKNKAEIEVKKYYQDDVNKFNQGNNGNSNIK